MELSRNVYLIGFMGAGKSTIARRIARVAGVVSLDMDKYIERSYGKPIPEIFEDGGEELFRRIESQTLREISEGDGHILVSCGGGIIETPENVELLKSPDNVVVHLMADADEARARISDLSSRPLFQDIDSARALFARRLPLYEDASDFTVSAGDRDTREVAREVMGFLRKEGVLCQQPE